MCQGVANTPTLGYYSSVPKGDRPITRQETNYSFLILQFVRRHNVLRFTRQDLVNDNEFMTQLSTITKSNTPESQSDYLLQRLRDNNVLTFIDYNGTYEVVTGL